MGVVAVGRRGRAGHCAAAATPAIKKQVSRRSSFCSAPTLTLAAVLPPLNTTGNKPFLVLNSQRPAPLHCLMSHRRHSSSCPRNQVIQLHLPHTVCHHGTAAAATRAPLFLSSSFCEESVSRSSRSSESCDALFCYCRDCSHAAPLWRALSRPKRPSRCKRRMRKLMRLKTIAGKAW